MLRKLTKTALACAYTWAGQGSAKRSLPFIVGYHRVVENFDRSARHAIPSLLITTRMLEKHIDWLAARFDILPLDQIGQTMETYGTFSRPAAAITFDDGYSDFYRNAYPIFKRKGIPAAVFVVTDLVDTPRLQIYDRLYLMLSRFGQDKDALASMTSLLSSRSQEEIESLIVSLERNNPVDKAVAEEMAPLNWGMIKEMHANGITIGSHTQSHTLLTQETLDRVHRELVGSREVLEQQLGSPVRHFAYPDGRFNPAITAAVAAAGYRYGYGICRTRDSQFPLLTIPRKVLWERACLNAIGEFSPAVMNCHAQWVFDGNRRCEHDHSEQYNKCHDHLTIA